MRLFLCCLFLAVGGSLSVVCVGQVRGDDRISELRKSCAPNRDRSYDRHNILDLFSMVLRRHGARSSSVVGEKAQGFFVYDLTDTSNRDMPLTGCIDLIDGHIYHFSSTNVPSSVSQLAVVDKGSVRLFESINCGNKKARLMEVVKDLEPRLRGRSDKKNILDRVKNYRRYGMYITVDESAVRCNGQAVKNVDDNYVRAQTLREMARVLKQEVPVYNEKYDPYLSVQDEQAIGFFVYDLTDPSNKQTSLLERVNFIKGHVYHFALIDLPFSFSNIAIFVDGKLKVFRTVNCSGKGDNIQDVVEYLKSNLTNIKEKSQIIDRVKNYRKYGVYIPFLNESFPRCEELSVEPDRRAKGI